MAISTHMKLLGACLQHAPAAQLSQLARKRGALDLLADVALRCIPTALSVLAGQGAGSMLGEGQQAGQEGTAHSMRVSIHHSMLEATADALRLEALAVRMRPPNNAFLVNLDVHLYNWARALERAAACTWWEKGAEGAASSGCMAWACVGTMCTGEQGGMFGGLFHLG